MTILTASKSVRTAALECAYLERGPADGTPVLLVHGFPDDARTWDLAAAALATDGYRTIAPFVRGFGPTRLLPSAPRSGEIAAIARDTLDLADALGVRRFHIIGHDWGARAAYAIAALAPERLLTLTALAVAYGTNIAAQRLDVEQMRAYWYQWYFATPRGAAALRDGRADFCRDLWRTWSPGWAFSAQEYATTAESFENPDFVEIVLHSYRQRWGFASGDPLYAADGAVLGKVPQLTVPALVMMGRDDGATLFTSAIGTQPLFSGECSLQIVDGAGHFLQREVADTVISAVRAALRRDPAPERREP